MASHDAESGFELVLDNRKLMVVFAVLIAFCGCFFLVGYHLGKGQKSQEEAQNPAFNVQQKMNPEPSQAQASMPSTQRPAGATEETKPAEEAASDQRLDWYRNVSRPESAPGKAPPAASSRPEAKTAASAPPLVSGQEKPKTRASAGSATYSVQVGAFRDKSQLDARAKMLQAKGFEYWIEQPQAPGQFYFLKVGRFPSRAEAVAMRHRLEQSGFSSFVKANQ